MVTVYVTEIYERMYFLPRASNTKSYFNTIAILLLPSLHDNIFT